MASPNQTAPVPFHPANERDQLQERGLLRDPLCAERRLWTPRKGHLKGITAPIFSLIAPPASWITGHGPPPIA